VLYCVDQRESRVKIERCELLTLLQLVLIKTPLSPLAKLVRQQTNLALCTSR